jgi:hypothetical protein
MNTPTPLQTLLVSKPAKSALEPFLRSSTIAAVAEISNSGEIGQRIDLFKRQLAQASPGKCLLVALKL